MALVDDPYEREFASLAPILLAHGWLLSPRLLGGEMAALKRYADELASMQSPPSRREVERELGRHLVYAAFHPNYRAYYVWLAMQQPYVSGLSHLLEQATLHYFGHDFLSCVHLLLPFLDGSLRAQFGATGGLRYGEMVARLREERPVRSYPNRHRLYRDALGEFAERWLFTPTRDADFEFSHLNRHYAAHGLGPECYYRPEDCHRLFLFADLYMEMLVLESGVGEYAFIPEEPAINRRREHYTDLLIRAEASGAVSTSLALMREHSHFDAAEDREPFYATVERWADIMGLDSRSGSSRAASAPRMRGVIGRALQRFIRLKRWREVRGTKGRSR